MTIHQHINALNRAYASLDNQIDACQTESEYISLLNDLEANQDERPYNDILYEYAHEIINQILTGKK
jgi:hypothetical protein